MDKLGPLCRAVEDCALVMSAIYGPDGQDESVFLAEDFHWNPEFDWRTLRVGYVKASFEPEEAKKTTLVKQGETAEERKKREQEALAARRREYDLRYDRAALDKLKSMGVQLIPVELPDLPYDAITPLLTAEAAAAFDSLTISGLDRRLTEQGPEDWPNAFRIFRCYPAVEYIQANRARTLVVREWTRLFEQIDILVTPSGGRQLGATNLTGHPAVIVPNGLRGSAAPVPPAEDTGEEDNIGCPRTPVSITFLAGHYQDAKLCAFARAYQEATGFHRSHPTL
jgi:Asp-tRNA(Asn)/Glu-tRNA(Gln) amidotransferase A subunit family amidase